MKQIEFISKHQIDRDRARHFRAFAASCIFHGFLICLIVGLAFIYWPHLRHKKSGSPQSNQSISFSTLVIVSSPPKISPPAPILSDQKKSPVSLSPRVALSEPQATAPLRLPAPKESAPVLTPQPAQISHTQTTQSKPLPRPAISHTSTTTTDAAPTHTKPIASALASSYAPGASVLPHPPYPPEARDRGQTGTVTVSVQFDAQGSVAETHVVQSSGVPLLDLKTRTFIRDHWHSLAYAGQTVNVPIQYTLENL